MENDGGRKPSIDGLLVDSTFVGVINTVFVFTSLRPSIREAAAVTTQRLGAEEGGRSNFGVLLLLT